MHFQPGLGAHINRATAILLGNTFARIKKEGGPLTPRTVVDDARPAQSPTHALFEWNDSIAGEKYRIEQAGHYLREVDILIVDKENETHVRVRAVQSEGRRGYDFTTRILKNPNRRKDLLAKALNEFKQWQARWETLEELASVFAAAEKVRGRKKAA